VSSAAPNWSMLQIFGPLCRIVRGAVQWTVSEIRILKPEEEAARSEQSVDSWVCGSAGSKPYREGAWAVGAR
jgi:hypothetical protein